MRKGTRECGRQSGSAKQGGIKAGKWEHKKAMNESRVDAARQEGRDARSPMDLFKGY